MQISTDTVQRHCKHQTQQILEENLKTNLLNVFLTNVNYGYPTPLEEVAEASSEKSSNAIVSPCLGDTCGASVLEKLDKTINVRLAFPIPTG